MVFYVKTIRIVSIIGLRHFHAHCTVYGMANIAILLFMQAIFCAISKRLL